MRVIHICFKFQLFFPIWLFYSLKYPFKWLILVVFCCYHQVGSHRLRTLFFLKKAVKFLFICSTAHRSYLREPNIFRCIIEPKKRKKEKRTRNERKNLIEIAHSSFSIWCWFEQKPNSVLANKTKTTTATAITHNTRKKLVIKNRNAEKYE